MKNFLNIFLALFVVITLSGCTKTTTLRTTHDYRQTLVKSNHMATLPPLVEVNSIDASGKATRKHDYEYELEDTITDVLIAKLHQKGYKAKPINKRQIHDLKLSRHVLTFQEDYQLAINKLYDPLLLEEKKAFAIDIPPLRDDATALTKATEADNVIFVEYYARIKTSGANTADFAKNFARSVLTGGVASTSIEDAAEFLSIRVAIIDAITHKIIWSNLARDGYSTFSSTFTASNKLDRKRISQLLDVILEKLPAK